MCAMEQVLPGTPGQVERYDVEYERTGVAYLIQLYAPCIGWRRTDVADTHTALHWAHRRVTAYSMSTRNGTGAAGETGVGLHAQTWELVDYGGVRVQRRVETLCQFYCI